MDNRGGGFIGGGPGWLLPSQLSAQSMPPSLLQMAQGVAPQMPQGGTPQMADINSGGDTRGGGVPSSQTFGGWEDAAIAVPPAKWQSQSAAYDKAGLGSGWIHNNEFENPGAQARTKAGPQMPHGINPYTDIVYGGSSGQEGQGSGFYLADPSAPGGRGADLFGGRQFQQGNLPKNIPEQLQPWLAPALMRYFYQQGYTGQGGSGINAPWTGAYAPTAPKLEHPTWPGIAKYDPWHRDMGAYANLYS